MKQNILQIRTPFEKLGTHRLILSINGEEVLVDRHFTQIQQLRKLPFWPNSFAHQIRKSFREGSIDTFILDQKGGLTSLGAEYWRVLGQHRYEMAHPIVSSEAGKKCETDVHHALSL